MLRFAMLFMLIPAAALAQAPAQVPKTAPTPKPAATKPPAPRPATRKPVAAPKPPAPATTVLTDDQKTIYALGILLQHSLDEFDLSSAELEIVKRAITDSARKRPAVDLDEWGPKIGAFARARGERVVARERAASATYLARAAAEAGAVRTESGLVYRELSAGTGASPTVADAVRVHYRGTLMDGTEFDNSYTRSEAAQFSLGGVIGCWTEGLQKMKVGGKARLVCPSDLAYGDGGRPSIPGGAALIFEVELLEIVAGR
jgi:FKBP-type peptidyl-prolyl cis-trans isomerase FkpA